MYINKKKHMVKMWRKGNVNRWQELQIVAATLENSMVLKKLKIELPYDPAILFLGIYPKKSKTAIQKDICTPMFITALFTIANTGKKPKFAH